MGYTKLFGDIVASSIWDEDDKTRIVWVTMLALKDRAHFVRGTERYLALAARVTPEECGRALKKLLSPDKKSRSPENEGRRIEERPGGWVVLNGEKYQKLLSYEERKAYNREKQAEYRRRKKARKETAKVAGATEAIKDGLQEANLQNQ
jgi:hypothetical protein